VRPPTANRNPTLPRAPRAQREEWRGARERHADLVEAALIRYWRIIHDATPEAPVTLPRAHWVRTSPSRTALCLIGRRGGAGLGT
jgi:hypothetical protein